MPETPMVPDRDRAGQALPPGSFDKLQELIRHGYLPEPQPDPRTGGIVLRHAGAPDLVLRPDGAIDLPVDQPVKLSERASPAAPVRRILWRRLFFVLVLTAIFAFVSMVLTIGILADA